jgi:hypothetical protein
MSSAIFSSGYESYQATGIVYAGPVHEIPEQHRRNGSTHSFKIITGLGASFSYYKDADSAKKARGTLAAMLDTLRPKAFKHGYEFIDTSRIVSFSNVVQFKKPVEEYTHGFVVTVLTADEKDREIWLRYKSEDHACKGRKAIWAALHSVNGLSNTDAKPTGVKVEAMAGSDGMPF